MIDADNDFLTDKWLVKVHSYFNSILCLIFESRRDGILVEIKQSGLI